jgi:hypothetical protein
MQLLIRHKYIMISLTHRQKRIFMHNISRKYPNKYSNILKAQILKRITKDTKKIMGWEEMCTKCQNLGRNPREKHTRCHDKSIKMQRCVYGREREASLRPIEILTGWAIARSAYGKIALVLDVRISPSTHNTLKILKLEENLQTNNFSKGSFRTRMYNQQITQSESISKLSRDKKESWDFNMHE